MRAALLTSVPGELELVDLEIDSPGPHEILIRTAACGLCHSDLHVMTGDLPQPPPIVLGHEAAGIVEAVGSEITDLAPGDHVVTCLSAFCGHCDECRTGRSWLCQQRGTLRRSASEQSRLTRNGDPIGQMSGLAGFAEQMLVHRNAAVKVPDALPLDRAALLGCAVVTGVGSVVNEAKVQPGSTVAVIGAGGIGCNIVQGAVLAGASRVIAIDVHREKLDLAKTFGATDVVDASSNDPVEAVTELSGGGVDYAFEAIGMSATVQQAIEMTRPGRTAYLVGVPPLADPIPIPAGKMVLTGRGVQGVFMGSNHFPRDITMLADLYLQGRLKLDELLADRIALDDVNSGFDAMRTGNAARSVITFS